MSFWKKVFGIKKSTMAAVAEGQSSGPQHRAPTPFGAFLRAVEEDNLGKVKTFLKSDSDLASTKDDEGWTPLHTAAVKGHKDAAELLLANGANVNSRLSGGGTPLHTAVLNGHKDVVEFLLASGADPDGMDKWGTTPLDYAAEKGHKAIVDLLLANGAYLPQDNSFESPPRRAERNGHKELAELLRQRQTSQALRLLATTALTPAKLAENLISEAGRGDTAVVEALLKKGADVNAKSNGNTALIFASMCGHAQVVKLLLERGADVNALDKSGKTALMLASYNGRFEVLQALLNNGADVNIRDEDDWTALILACNPPYPQKVRREVAQALLDKGADVNAKNRNGDTALIGASQSGHAELVQTLLEKGVDVNAKRNINGRTALMEAARSGDHRGLVQALLDKGADVTAKDNEGKTALMLASYNGHREVVHVLKGAETTPSPATSSDDIPTDPIIMGEQAAMMNAQAWVWRAELDDSIQFILHERKMIGIWLANFPTNAPKRTVLQLFCVKEQKRDPNKALMIEAIKDRIYNGKYEIRRNTTKGGYDVFVR